MKKFSQITNEEFISDALSASDSPVGGEYLRMYLKEAVRRLEIAGAIVDEWTRECDEGTDQ